MFSFFNRLIDAVKNYTIKLEEKQLKDEVVQPKINPKIKKRSPAPKKIQK